MENEKQLLEKYADLILKIGINFTAGEGVVINADSEALPLVRLIMKKAYEAGAKDVVFNYSEDEMTLIRYQSGRDEVFSYYPECKATCLKGLYDENYHHIMIRSSGPDLLKQIDGYKIAEAQKAGSKVSKETGLMAYRMTGKTKWVIAAVPSVDWAKAVFPELSDTDAVKKLWQMIAKSVRLDQPDPIEAWLNHDAYLKRRVNWLNDIRLEKVHYQAPGTDLWVTMAETHSWVGGSKESQAGVPFTANMPTEEVFSTPHARKADGTLRSTMPLSYNGKLIDGMEFRFKDGKVIEFHAEEGQDVLEKAMAQDDGAKSLGEIALVPYDSPISNTKVIFKNTLFDENASCHFALGQSYGYAMIDGEKKNEEELVKLGANQSTVHIDFMVGGPQLNITGYGFDGTVYPIFRDGNWAD